MDGVTDMLGLPAPLPRVANVAHIIQLALAPVFLLTGIGAFLGVCAGRLARIVDRSRWILDRLAVVAETEHDRLIAELRLLDRRIRIVSRAILLCILSAGLVCLIVMLLFASEIVGASFSRTIALIFIAAMALLATAYGIFVAEIRLSLRTVRIAEEILARPAARSPADGDRPEGAAKDPPPPIRAGPGS